MRGVPRQQEHSPNRFLSQHTAWAFGFPHVAGRLHKILGGIVIVKQKILCVGCHNRGSSFLFCTIVNGQILLLQSFWRAWHPATSSRSSTHLLMCRMPPSGPSLVLGSSTTSRVNLGAGPTTTHSSCFVLRLKLLFCFMVVCLGGQSEGLSSARVWRWQSTKEDPFCFGENCANVDWYQVW